MDGSRQPCCWLRIQARPRLSTFTRRLVRPFVHELAVQRTMGRGCMPARGSRKRLTQACRASEVHNILIAQ
jgi:hypothetical protein